MSDMVVFLGPSASRAEFAAIVDAEIRPPAGQGDLFRAVRDGAERIGIVDGYFDSTPAVMHKEILWAISEGVEIFGAASMGALRAAELHGFGVQGVGWVFEAFASGRLEDDDEVAIIHAPARLHFAPVSEAMVNIRRTLARAADEAVLSADEAAALTHIAKQLYYAEREWPRLLDLARRVVTPPALADLARWLPTGRVDVKRDDAIALARVLADPDRRRGQTARHYEPTVLVENVRRAASRVSSGPDDLTALIDTWRMREPAALIYELIALIDALTFEREQSGQAALDEPDLVHAVQDFGSARGLEDGDAAADWLRARNLTEVQLLAVLSRDARLLKARDALAPLIARHLADRILFREDGAALIAQAALSGTAGYDGDATAQNGNAGILGNYRIGATIIPEKLFENFGVAADHLPAAALPPSRQEPAP